jgi:hypothetical protein
MPYLAVARSAVEAARLADVARSTLYRWMKDPFFRDELETRRREAADLARSEMDELMQKAVMTLREVMDDPNSRARVDAARTLIYANMKSDYIRDLESRIQQMSDAMALRQKRNPYRL